MYQFFLSPAWIQTKAKKNDKAAKHILNIIEINISFFLIIHIKRNNTKEKKHKNPFVYSFVLYSY